MRKELLLELADFLEKLEPHRFDIAGLLRIHRVKASHIL